MLKRKRLWLLYHIRLRTTREIKSNHTFCFLHRIKELRSPLLWVIRSLESDFVTYHFVWLFWWFRYTKRRIKSNTHTGTFSHLIVTGTHATRIEMMYSIVIPSYITFTQIITLCNLLECMLWKDFPMLIDNLTPSLCIIGETNWMSWMNLNVTHDCVEWV